ncbi:N-6 DNA Methylase [compost metagenome]
MIGNPPYGVSIDVDDAELPDAFETLKATKGRAKGKTESAFIELAIKAAKPGGYIAFVLPKSIGFGAGKVRDIMRESCWHIASIELPGTTFALTGTTIPTDIHILRKVTPNATKVHVKYSQKGNGRFPLDIVEQTDESEAQTFWYDGQMPVLQAQITDIGYDKDGKSTDKWGDGQTQLDELLKAFEDTLMRENSDPVAPFKGDHHAFNVKVPPYEEWRTKANMIAYWNVLTLGRGEEINGVSSFDFGWQDRIVSEYYAELAQQASVSSCVKEAA